MSASKIDEYIVGLKDRVSSSHSVGGWLTETDKELLTALVDSNFNDNETVRSEAEQTIMSFELAADSAAFDEDGEVVTDAPPEDGLDEEEELPAGEYPKSRIL